MEDVIVALLNYINKAISFTKSLVYITTHNHPRVYLQVI